MKSQTQNVQVHKFQTSVYFPFQMQQIADDWDHVDKQINNLTHSNLLHGKMGFVEDTFCSLPLPTSCLLALCRMDRKIFSLLIWVHTQQGGLLRYTLGIYIQSGDFVCYSTWRVFQ
uniref:Uncharacterized protein n=1 Tax=Cacopsylla melanoneura TaxID=428564 RepID=A0A8D8QV67_9HEMI